VNAADEVAGVSDEPGEDGIAVVVVVVVVDGVGGGGGEKVEGDVENAVEMDTWEEQSWVDGAHG